MRFKEYLIKEDTKNLNEELIQGGLLKLFKQLEYWLDGNDASVEHKIEKLQQTLVNAGGPSKFAMVVRRIPSIKHFLKKHHDELTDDLSKTANLI